MVAPGGRFDRRRAHALVCDSRRSDAEAELTGVGSAEPPVWTDGVVPMSLPAMPPALGIARPALVSGLSPLAARRPSITRGGGPRSGGRLGSHALGSSTDQAAQSFWAVGAAVVAARV
ncbi:MAG: hypothetical protein ACRDPW_11375 [Mycobacteriales bacterium]